MRREDKKTYEAKGLEVIRLSLRLQDLLLDMALLDQDATRELVATMAETYRAIVEQARHNRTED